MNAFLTVLVTTCLLGSVAAAQLSKTVVAVGMRLSTDAKPLRLTSVCNIIFEV